MLRFCYLDRVRLPLAWVLVLAMLGGGSLWSQQWGVLPGRGPLATLTPGGGRVVVLYFVATDCPVSNRMFPEMRRLREAFQGRGVQFWYVYPNTSEHEIDISQHQQIFDDRGSALTDPAGALVRLAGAVATPEMAVLVPAGKGWRMVYAGRIDDRFVRLGLERPAATEHFGEEAIRAVLAGRMPRPATGRPVGCAIMNPGAAR